jgi:hypothetical protein
MDWGAPSNWDTANTQASWHVQDGALCGSGHTFISALKGDAWKDYVAKFRLKLASGSTHLNLRQTAATGGFDRYFFGVGPTGFNVSKQTGVTFKDILESLNVPFPLNQWADIELVAQGNRIVMVVNGVIVIDFADGDNPYNTGAFTLETLDSSTACVDDIVVSDLTGKPPFDMLYEQRFDTAQSPTGWNTTNAEGLYNTAWKVKNGAFCGEGHNWAVFNNLSLTDFTMRYRLTMKSGSAHLNFRIGDRTRYYTWVSTNDSTVSLSRDTPGKAGISLTAGRARILPDQGYDVRFSAVGGRIQFWLNGERVYDFTDATPLGAGIIGFESLDTQYVCIDDLVITLPSLVQPP